MAVTYDFTKVIKFEVPITVRIYTHGINAVDVTAHSFELVVLSEENEIKIININNRDIIIRYVNDIFVHDTGNITVFTK